MTMRKICVLTTGHGPFDDRIYHREAVSLACAGYQVTLVAPGIGSSMRNGVKIVSFRKHGSRFERFLLTAYRAMHAALEVNADVYHFHDPDLLPWMAVLAMTGKKVVYDVHEYYGFTLQTSAWLPQLLRKPTAKVMDWFEKNASSLFAGIITVNPHMQNLFLNVNQHVITVRNLPLPWFINQTDHRMPGSRMKTVYVGGMNMQRGYGIIMKTMQLVRERLPEAECQIVGSVDYSDVDESVARLGDGSSATTGVEGTGFVPFERVPQYLNDAAVCWLPLQSTPNYEHAEPVKLFEYMASGRPIVASNLKFVKKIISHAQCGILVPPDDPRAHADAHIHLFTHPKEAAEMGARGRKAVLEHYNWKNEEQTMLHFYHDLLSTKVRTR
jgi:glycosyltransferase involved in cell wall biosynthesis